jgi:hypothetical protein
VAEAPILADQQCQAPLAVVGVADITAARRVDIQAGRCQARPAAEGTVAPPRAADLAEATMEEDRTEALPAAAILRQGTTATK